MNFDGLQPLELGKLFAIAAGAMTVLYILRLRRRRVQVPFSPLWSRVVEERQSTSLFRALKRIGSLLVQWLVIALIVLALGDPHLAGLAGCDGTAPKAAPPHHALVLIDASASMATIEHGRTRLERARAEAHAAVDRLATGPGQSVMIAQVDATTRPLSLWSSDPAVLHAAIDHVAGGPDAPALDTPTAIDDALRFAEDTLRGRENAETILVSDGAFEPIPEPRRAALDLRLVQVGDAGENLGIEAFNVRPYLDDSLTYAVWYAVRNDTDHAVHAALFLYANPTGRAEADFVDGAAPARGATLVQTIDLTLPPRQTTTAVASDVKFEGSRLFARLAPDSADPLRDVFPRDDIAFATVPPRRVLKVQLVSDGDLYLNAALFLRENVKLTVTSPAEYAGPDGFDVTVLDGVSVPMDQPGNYFVVGPVAPPPGAPPGPFKLTGTLQQPAPARIDQKHPLARFVKFVDLDILEAPVIAPEKGDEVVVATASGAPLVFVRRDEVAGGARKMVVIAFDIRRSYLPMSYGFPLLVVNALSWFYQDPEGLLQPNRAGLPLSLPLTLDGPGIHVRGPGDDAGTVARRVGDRVRLTAPRLGIYELETDLHHGTMAVAVNLLSPEESQVSPRASAVGAWSAPPVVAVVTPSPWLVDLWRTLLVAAIAVVVLEWLTWHRRWTV